MHGVPFRLFLPSYAANLREYTKQPGPVGALDYFDLQHLTLRHVYRLFLRPSVGLEVACAKSLMVYRVAAAEPGRAKSSAGPAGSAKSRIHIRPFRRPNDPRVNGARPGPLRRPLCAPDLAETLRLSG